MGNDLIQTWDYLVITASDEAQARAYEGHLRKRRDLGMLRGIGETLAVPDPAGARIGSGGSTALAVSRVLETLGCASNDLARVEDALRSLRILIIHGGGDSRRLPCYGPAGKVFLPVPANTLSALPTALFDRLLPALMALPGPCETGHVVISSGDVLLEFAPESVAFGSMGITGLACKALPETASRHGVYHTASDGRVLQFFQKPSLKLQHDKGLVGVDGHALLDIGIMSLAPDACAALLALCGPRRAHDADVAWDGLLAEAVMQTGLDFYTEVCCALGEEASFDDYLRTVRLAGSRLTDRELRSVYDRVRNVTFQACPLPDCHFLHFGSLPHLIASGCAMESAAAGSRVVMNSKMGTAGSIEGGPAWVEACSMEGALTLHGGNVAVGLDVAGSLALPCGACIDVVPGKDAAGETFFCLRACHIEDNPKAVLAEGATWNGLSLADLPAKAGTTEDAIWTGDVPVEERSLWNARVHPVISGPGGCAEWLWLFDLADADAAAWQRWRNSPRYSMADMARFLDHDAFVLRRERLHASAALPGMIDVLGRTDGPSARDIASAVLASGDDGKALAERFCTLVAAYARPEAQQSLGALEFASALHTLGSAAGIISESEPRWMQGWHALLSENTQTRAFTWLNARGLTGPAKDAAEWPRRARAEAFEQLRKAVVFSAAAGESCPRSCLRSDEIVWGRAPARLDLAGGWTDTPPYALERGGCVLNAAVDLNGQSPIQAHGRVIPERVIRLTSTDQGNRVEIRTLEELLDYRTPASEFALPKAVLALSGLAPGSAPWSEGATLDDILGQFGGGIELTTLAAVPRGSGLGTSSIMGAVLLAIVHRIMGRELSQHDLFHHVLRVEQSLTTGGGWQDQIGGVTPGVKTITTAPGLIPNPEFVQEPGDLLDPAVNGGATLLYYTGITRLAKNILEKVVARYLDRDRATLAVLERIKSLPARAADAMREGESGEFGRCIGAAWELKKEIDPGATSPEIDAIFDRAAPYVHGAKIMGAGGGGFMLFVCKTPNHARQLREMLELEPPNPRARFFDMSLNTQGLVVTVC